MIKNMINNKNTKGITLIALIITIVVMLILVVVSIQIALETGLFESAGKATKNWELAQEQEGELGKGKVNVGGTVYNSIEEYKNSIKTEENEEVDFEKLFATAEKHPDQSETNNDIGIAEDGSIVNLDVWPYLILSDGKSYALNEDLTYGDAGYSDENIVNGKIQGKIPMFIKEEGKESFFPVTSLIGAFKNCTSLTIAPKIPSTVTNMTETFSGCTSLNQAPEIPSAVTSMKKTFEKCTLLTEAPVIPNLVTDMSLAFYECTSLTQAPVIPNSVTNMASTFADCTLLTKAPAIPNSVIDMGGTFSDCTSLTEAPVIPSSVLKMSVVFSNCSSLTGTLTINANPTSYLYCLSGAATNEGCNLVLNGSSTILSDILATKSENSNISLGS